MKFAWDAAKDSLNLAKHGVSLTLATRLEWETALVWRDRRRDYGEPRMAGIGYVEQRLYFVVYIDSEQCRRVISMRKANSREVRRYAETETGNDPPHH